MGLYCGVSQSIFIYRASVAIKMFLGALQNDGMMRCISGRTMQDVTEGMDMKGTVRYCNYASLSN